MSKLGKIRGLPIFESLESLAERLRKEREREDEERLRALAESTSRLRIHLDSIETKIRGAR